MVFGNERRAAPCSRTNFCAKTILSNSAKFIIADY